MSDVVKVDKKLLKDIDELIKKEKYKYSSKKQVVNLAIIEFLNSKNVNSLRKRTKTVDINKKKKRQTRSLSRK